MTKRFKVNRELIVKETLSETMKARILAHAEAAVNPKSVYKDLAKDDIPETKCIQITPTIYKGQLKKLVYMMDEFGYGTMGLMLGKMIDHAFDNLVIDKHRKENPKPTVPKPTVPKPPPKGVYGIKAMGI